MSGAAPVGSGMGAGTPAGGSSKAGLVSATGPADEDDKDPEDRRAYGWVWGYGRDSESNEK